jgi:hypothetical protein
MEINTLELLSIYDEILYVNNFDAATVSLEGSYNKRILLFVGRKEYTDENKSMVLKMITACKLDVQDVGIAKISAQEEILPVINYNNPTYILNFGMPLANEVFKQIQVPNKVREYSNAKIINTYSLTQLNAKPNLKVELWQALQIMFGITKE